MDGNDETIITIIIHVVKANKKIQVQKIWLAQMAYQWLHWSVSSLLCSENGKWPTVILHSG